MNHHTNHFVRLKARLLVVWNFMIMSVCKEKKREKVLVHFNEERSVRTICSNGIILKGNKIDNDHRSKKKKSWISLFVDFNHDR